MVLPRLCDNFAVRCVFPDRWLEQHAAHGEAWPHQQDLEADEADPLNENVEVVVQRRFRGVSGVTQHHAGGPLDLSLLLRLLLDCALDRLLLDPDLLVRRQR